MAKILRIQDRDDALVATPNVARFDLPETDKLRDELEDATSDSETKPLLLDLSSVEFVTSATLGVLAELAKRCRAEDRPLALIRVRPKVLQVLQLSHMDRLFSIHADEKEALASL
jgi:anti-sigma B factor antagonist